MTPSRNNPVIANPAPLGVAIQMNCFVAARLAKTTGDKA